MDSIVSRVLSCLIGCFPFSFDPSLSAADFLPVAFAESFFFGADFGAELSFDFAMLFLI